ncbi:MAG: hypothetical protein KKH20_01620, partial [Proteobacteria bacterium]|nr:hypothetical protein [Pseudomonadota bacterium]
MNIEYLRYSINFIKNGRTTRPPRLKAKPMAGRSDSTNLQSSIWFRLIQLRIFEVITQVSHPLIPMSFLWQAGV